MGWGFGSVAEYLPTMHEALGSIPQITIIDCYFFSQEVVVHAFDASTQKTEAGSVDLTHPCRQHSNGEFYWGEGKEGS